MYCLTTTALTGLGNKTSKDCAFCRIERHARECYPTSPGKPYFLEPSGIIGRIGGARNKFYVETNIISAK